MSIKKVEMNSRYQLRYAAGQYWLLNMEQPGVPYRRPMCMNAMGAEIWNRMIMGFNNEQIAEVLTKEYEVGVEEIREDIVQFQKQLAVYGVAIEE